MGWLAGQESCASVTDSLCLAGDVETYSIIVSIFGALSMLHDIRNNARDVPNMSARYGPRNQDGGQNRAIKMAPVFLSNTVFPNISDLGGRTFQSGGREGREGVCACHAAPFAQMARRLYLLYHTTAELQNHTRYFLWQDLDAQPPKVMEGRLINTHYQEHFCISSGTKMASTAGSSELSPYHSLIGKAQFVMGSE